MSNDTVDDLHQAEDFAADCVGIFGDLLKYGSRPEVMDRVRAKIAEWAVYCRPCCGWLDAEEGEEPECGEGGPVDGCGCPCRHPGHPDNDEEERGA